MPGAGRAEVYFIAAMMILIVILSVVACVVFYKTYKKEMREKAERQTAPKTVTADGVDDNKPI
jgi:hypothetical protein